MKRILVSAYACEPFKGSEQAVGWNIVLQMAKFNEVHVITRANNEEYIEPNVPAEVRHNISFHYYDSSFFMKLKHKEKGVYFYYFIWQLGIIPIIKHLIVRFNIDYTFHLTLGSIWLPTFLPFFGPKFIWGPVGGGESIPGTFLKTLSFKGRLLQYSRYILKYLRYFNLFWLLSVAKASVVFYRTEMTRDLIPKQFQNKCFFLADGAIEPDIVLTHKKIQNNSGTVELVATGRLIHTKNVVTIIEALHIIPDEFPVHLTLVGSGPEEPRLKRMIKDYHLDSRITHIPFVPRNEVFTVLENSDIYVFASLKEACNLSLLEAMAVGLPVICLDWSGMSLSTDESCAIRLSPTNPEQMALDMADAIMKLSRDKNMREKMGEAGRERIKTLFNWDSKGLFINRILDELDQNH